MGNYNVCLINFMPDGKGKYPLRNETNFGIGKMSAIDSQLRPGDKIRNKYLKYKKKYLILKNKMKNMTL